MSKNNDIPKIIWSGSFSIFGVEVKCHVLDDGQRIIEEDSMVALFDGTADVSSCDEKELEKFSCWQKGVLA